MPALQKPKGEVTPRSDRPKTINPHGPTVFKREKFDRDIMFGANSPRFEERALKEQAATDSTLPFDRDPQAFERYKEAHGKIHGRPLIENAHQVRMAHQPWDTLKFADRDGLNKDRPYVDYSRQAVKTALDRGGKVFFASPAFNAHTHFKDALRVEMEKTIPYQTYIQSVSYRQQQGHDVRERLGGSDPFQTGDEADLRLAEEAAKLRGAQPLLTSIELADFLEGGLRDVPVQYSDAAGKDIDRLRFAELYLAAREAVFSPENITCFSNTGMFSAEATAAVDALQKLMSGDSGQVL